MQTEVVEDWQLIEGTYNIYAVSDRGRIGKVIGNEVDVIIDVDDEGRANKKYKTVWLFGKKYYVHRLVAQYFLLNPNTYPHVNHINSDSHFNCVTNLEWVPLDWNNKHRTWLPRTKFNWETLRWELKSGKMNIR